MPFQLLRSETLLQGRAFAIRRDWMKTPDGRETKFDIIEHGGSVVIAPLDSDGNLLFVRQYRHATGRELLELPAGTLNEGEHPDVCAAREMREETGFAAGTLERLGEFFLAPGYSTEFMVVYLATDLTHDPLEADADEFLSVERVSIGRALDMARRGEMPDAKSLAALFLCEARLQG
ncbi:MAG: ADP-ribose pyrophosphatase [Anaerolineales bacterium]|nr:ADP-ribose pyrophosphatase [Anaerolineales bacterium]